MTHKNCGGELHTYKLKTNPLVLARNLSPSDHVSMSNYSAPIDSLLRCVKCGLTGIESK